MTILCRFYVRYYSRFQEGWCWCGSDVWEWEFKEVNTTDFVDVDSVEEGIMWAGRREDQLRRDGHKESRMCSGLPLYIFPPFIPFFFVSEPMPRTIICILIFSTMHLGFGNTSTTINGMWTDRGNTYEESFDVRDYK